MKRVFAVFIFAVIINFGYLKVYSCTCVLDDLSKRYRKAQAVFVGKIADVEDGDKKNIQNYKEGLPVLYVVKSWKGVKKEYVAIDFEDFPKSVGTCSILYKFDEDKEYLVFTYGKEFKVEVECSDTRALKAEYNDTAKEISRLDNFWFRSKSKLKLF